MYKSMLFPVDELLPALYCETPRTELNNIFVKDMNAFSLPHKKCSRTIKNRNV